MIQFVLIYSYRRHARACKRKELDNEMGRLKTEDPELFEEKMQTFDRIRIKVIFYFIQLHNICMYTMFIHVSDRYIILGSWVLFGGVDPGMSLNCAPTRVCRKSASRPGYVVKVRTDPEYVVKQCPRIVMNKIFDWH